MSVCWGKEDSSNSNCFKQSLYFFCSNNNSDFAYNNKAVLKSDAYKTLGVFIDWDRTITKVEGMSDLTFDNKRSLQKQISKLESANFDELMIAYRRPEDLEYILQTIKDCT